MADATGNFLYDDVLPRVERISWLVAGIGLAFRYFLLRDASTLLIVGLGTIAVVYFLQAFSPEIEESGPELFIAYAPVSESPSLLRKFQYVASTLTVIGILFKLLFWEGQAELLMVGVLTLLVTISFKWAAGQLARPILLIAAMGLLTWAVPIDALVRQFYRDDPVLVAKMLFQQHHPGDKAATAEVLSLLHARRNR
jgi:hypothetical protein